MKVVKWSRFLIWFTFLLCAGVGGYLSDNILVTWYSLYLVALYWATSLFILIQMLAMSLCMNDEPEDDEDGD